MSQDTLDIRCILLPAPFKRSSLTITCEYDVEFSPHVVAIHSFPISAIQSHLNRLRKIHGKSIDFPKIRNLKDSTIR